MLDRVEVGVAIGHEMEVEEFHAAFLMPSMKPVSSATNTAAFSTCGMCPHSGMMTAFEPGISCLIGVGVFHREHPVVGAPHDQGRHVDPVQPFAQVRIVGARLPRELRGGDPVLHIDVFEFRTQQPRDHLVGARRVMEEIADALLVAAQEEVDLLGARHMDAGGADQRQRREPVGVADRKLGGDPAAERRPDEMDAVEIELLEEVEIEVGEVVDGIEPVRRIAVVEARMLRERSRRTGSASDCMNGSQAPAPLAPCRNSSGGPEPPRISLMLQPRTAIVVVA